MSSTPATSLIQHFGTAQNQRLPEPKPTNRKASDKAAQDPAHPVSFPETPNLALNNDPELGSRSATVGGLSYAAQSAPQAPTPARRRRDAFIPGFRTRPPFMTWLRRSWLDLLSIALCLITALMLYKFAPPVMPRYFPWYDNIKMDTWGLKYGQPLRPEYVNTAMSAVIGFVVPAVIMTVIGLWFIREFADTNAALFGLGYALATATLFQSLLKIFIGGLRPHFIAVCNPNFKMTNSIKDVRWHNPLTTCNGPADKVREAIMSFPSGHACAAFAGFGLLALWLNAKFKIFGYGRRSSFPHADSHVVSADGNTAAQGGRIQHWKLVLFAAPLVIAFLLSLSKLRDG